MLASIDSTPGQVVADALLVVVVAVNAYLGWSHGLIRRVVTAIGVFAGCFAATNLGNPIASLVHAHSMQANAWSFVAVFVFVVIVVEVLGALLNERLQKIVVAAFDRIVGTLLGIVIGVAEMLVLFLVAIAASGPPSTIHRTMSQDINAATLSGQVVRLAPVGRSVFGPVLPSNLATHLAENVVVVAPPV